MFRADETRRRPGGPTASHGPTVPAAGHVAPSVTSTPEAAAAASVSARARTARRPRAACPCSSPRRPSARPRSAEPGRPGAQRHGGSSFSLYRLSHGGLPGVYLGRGTRTRRPRACWPSGCRRGAAVDAVFVVDPRVAAGGEHLCHGSCPPPVDGFPEICWRCCCWASYSAQRWFCGAVTVLAAELVGGCSAHGCCCLCSCLGVWWTPLIVSARPQWLPLSVEICPGNHCAALIRLDGDR